MHVGNSGKICKVKNPPTVMCKLGQRDERIVAITAAMPDGTGLKRFRNMYPQRFFDVGSVPAPSPALHR